MQPGTVAASAPNPAVKTAIDLDLFRAVGKGPATAASLAAHCAASSAAFLDPASPTSLHTTARFLSLPELTLPYAELTNIVRTRRTVLPGEGTVEPDNPAWVDFAHSMAPMMGPSAGHGLFGIAIAKQNPEAHIMALDWANVLAVAEENARKAGVADRFTSLPGSAFDVDYGGPYDAILLTNFLHHFDVPTCVGLLKKVLAALKPGGVSATLEFVPNEDRVSPPMAAGFSLTMLTTTGSGDAYTFRELEAMHKEAGFQSILAHPVPHSPHTIVTGIAG